MKVIPNSRDLVVIPLFNEETTIIPVITETRKYYSGDILVINDGSTDQSLEQLRSVSDPSLFVLTHPGNLGYGKTLIDGFKFALENEYESLVTIDCDFQHEPACIPDFLRELTDVDVVSGSRYFFDFTGNSDAPADRFRINQIISSELNDIIGFKLTDAFCGFKAYNVKKLANLNLTETGYAMPLQFWIQAWQQDLIIKEIPVKRIYLNLKRTFGNGLDNPETRLAYYRSVLYRELNNASRCTGHRCASR